jgi:NADPH-dependent 2,4-dienoyl-CoA reductase/sulfur reductase-like enzyme
VLIQIKERAEHIVFSECVIVSFGRIMPMAHEFDSTRRAFLAMAAAGERVAAVDPEAQTVSTEGGETLDYDFLVVAPGLILDHDAIEGFSLDMVGENGIGALYAGPNTPRAPGRRPAASSRRRAGIFTRPRPR